MCLTLKYQQNEKDYHYFNRTISPDSVRLNTNEVNEYENEYLIE